MNNEFVQNDTLSKLQVTCFDETGKPLDLTFADSVQLQYYIGSYPPLMLRDMEIKDRANGVVEYQFGSVTDSYGDTTYDLYATGTLYYRIIVKFGSRVISTPQLGEIIVREALAG